jgi:drug/metabolite transporter (DMT)-like permease
MPATASPIDRIGWAAILIGSAIVCFTGVVMRFTDVGPLTSAAWRMTLALPVLGAWSALAGPSSAHQQARPSRKTVLLLVVVAGAAFTGDVGAFHFALASTSIANAAFIANMAPILTVLGGWFLFGERPRRAIWAALGLSLVGSWVMAGFASPAHLSAGDLFALAAAAFYAVYALAIKRLRDGLDGPASTLLSAAVAAILLWLAVAALERPILPQSAVGWGAVIFLGVASHALGQGLTSVALGRLPIAPIALVFLAQPVVAALLGYLIVGEAMNTHQLVGGALILVALALARPR